MFSTHTLRLGRLVAVLPVIGCLGWATLLAAEPHYVRVAPASQDTSLSLTDEGADGGLDGLDELLNADLDQLARTDVVVPVFSQEVTTVARQESSVGQSPAAVYVLTGDMIRRSGARSIPEALRLAPGVNVARIDANKYAISIRGFNQRFANKLLVQIDGRTVYTPLFAGVFWDVQDVLLEDVERIEIIRGPGASVWGENAVNGVINIITKRSDKTQGLFAEAGTGSERDFASARVGGQSGDTSWRAYGKWFDRSAGFSSAGLANDDWQMSRVGFRSDWQASACDTLTVQGDYYDGSAGETEFSPIPTPPFLSIGVDDQRLAGGNALMRWEHQFDEDSDWSLQVFYDRTERAADRIGFREDRDTVDVDFQHRFPWADWHSIIWGLGYRNTSDRVRNSFQLALTPPTRSLDTYSAFLQDEMTITEDLLFFTAGTKVSHNAFTGFEIQPTARWLWTPSERQSIWASVSRAVRVPSRATDDVQIVTAPSNFPIFPTFPVVRGDRAIEAEQVLAWEVGMRAAPTDEFYWDLAAFYNKYEDLQVFRAGTPGFDPTLGVFALPLTLFNGADADTYGFELASTWQIHPRWTTRGAYSFLVVDMEYSPLAFAANSTESNPRNQFFTHNSWDLGCNWQFDVVGRYVDTLSSLNIPSYFQMDSRLAWTPTAHLEFAVVGRNLLDSHQPEFNDDTIAGVFATEVQRELYGMMSLRY